ncbi:Acetyltransferase (isoleucine patch superfamily) [Flavobacterium limnosediminis JC2902]|uniref:Acetyltransferase (Isoleucine patch superfamily) n=1 Tax=Flavobacterium limnosediminis JC2902 TaxID=1341181 RepID=V6SLG2_9FLAO|nr:acetyltransferase [Flavobacterium limnosediminis]ESU27259.1 Acetyltransferase (isoleucine patch superfamily) [Flavobacterium limnosediminis JC2902]
MYIFGASGHGKVVKSIVEAMKMQLTAFVDDSPKGITFMGMPVFSTGQLQEVTALPFLIAVGNNAIRKKIAERLSAIYEIGIHPTAVIDSTATLGEGSVVMPNAVVNSDTEIGKHVIVNSGAVVEHDCILEDYVHLSPNATLAGNVFVGEGTQIGAGAVVLQGIKVGKWCMVGAGAVVLKDLPDNVTAVGNPARIIKEHNPFK